ADDDRGVADRVIEDADSAELVGKRPAREGDASRRTRQVDDSRRPHLPGHPPGIATQYLAHRWFPMPRLGRPETGPTPGADHKPVPRAAPHAGRCGTVPSQQGIAAP